MSKMNVPNSSDSISREAARKIVENFLHDCGYYVPRSWIYEELQILINLGKCYQRSKRARIHIPKKELINVANNIINRTA